MNNYKVVGLFVLFIGLSGKFYAQQSPTYSLYMLNTFLINPAAAGSEGYTSVNLNGREQWVGFPGTPSTYSFMFETRVLKNSFIAKALNLRKKFSKRSIGGRVGIGISSYVDRSGPISQSGLQLTYGYHIPLRQSQLSFGLTASGFNYGLDGTRSTSTMLDHTDSYYGLSLSKFVIDGNFGVQYSNPLYMVGLSVTNLFQSHFYFGNVLSNGLQLQRNYNILGSYKFELNRFLLLEPSTLLSLTQSGAAVYNLSTRLFYREDYWTGLLYRTGAQGGAFIFLAGMRVNKLYFGYAFDLTLSPIQSHTFGSHEFMVTMRFGENARRYRWLNRY